MESKEEIWKPVAPPYHENYQVSNFGNVKSLHSGQLLAFVSNEAGYKRVNFSLQNKSKKRPVHHVVAEAFVPRVEGKREVDHIDRDPTNNKAENLRWATKADQAKNRKPATTIKKWAVVQIDEKTLEVVASFPSTKVAGEHFRVSPSTICAWIKQNKIINKKYRLKRKNEQEFGPDLPGEEWKTIAFGEVKLMVSSLGRLQNEQGHRYIGADHNSGYKIANISSGKGKMKNALVHRLVCEAFHGPPPSPTSEANHKDLNKHNNRADNLEWNTGSENVKHAYKILGDDHGTIKLAKPVMQLDLDNNVIAVYKSVREATAILNKVNSSDVTRSMKSKISAVCNGRGKQHGGFKWKYIDKETLVAFQNKQTLKETDPEPTPKRRKIELSDITDTMQE